jgi:hypothetical protein
MARHGGPHERQTTPPTGHTRGITVMFANRSTRTDFADTQLMGMESALTFLTAEPSEGDAAETFAQAEAADRQLLRMVFGVACATFVLALVTSLH